MNLFADFGYLFSNYWSFFLKGIASTLVLSLVGTFGGLLLGIFLALAKNIRVKKSMKWFSKAWRYVLLWLANIYSTVIRGTPMMVQAMIFKYGTAAMGVNWNLILHDVDVFNGWLVAGLIVITFNTAAYMGEVVRAGLNGVDKGQYEGARSLGMTYGQAYGSVIFPQALRNSLPTIANEWIVNIKDSSVLNVIGVSELFLQGENAASKGYRYVAAYLIVALIYLILTLGVSAIVKGVEHKMDGTKWRIPFFHYKEAKA